MMLDQLLSPSGPRSGVFAGRIEGEAAKNRVNNLMFCPATTNKKPADPLRLGGQRDAVKGRLFALHELAANFAILIGSRVDIDIPLACREICRLGVSQGR